MKRILAIFLAAIMVAGLGTVAFAKDNTSGDSAKGMPPHMGEFIEGEAPEMPEGEAPQGERPELPDGEMPQMPEGEAPQGERPELPTGEMPQMPEGGAPQGERPELPEGEMPQMPEGEAPERPEGETPKGQGQPGQAAQGNSEIASLIQRLIEKLRELLGFTSNNQQMPGGEAPEGFDEQTPDGQMPQMPDGEAPADGEAQQGPNGQDSSNRPGGQQNGENNRPGGQQSGNENTNYTAAQTLTEDAAGTTYSSTADGENAVLVNGSSVTLTDITVSKTGSSSGDSADFYGINAAVLASNGATLTISDAEITTNGAHANGVFSYGSGTTVNISDSTITTSASNSGGIMTTGGATLNATNLTVSTSGNSSAAIRSDRGGGTVNVSEGSYSASGVGSPAIYSTADITVSDATLSATNSEAVVIEGGNSVTLTNSTISGNNAKLNGQSTVKTNVLIYQSMSGDASEGSSAFTMSGGSMIAGTGAMFHVTNVTTTINLSGVDFTYASDSNVFLDASSDSWGTSGKNGGKVTLNLNNQAITGIITTDSASSVAVNMTNGSTWTLTGDSYITSLSGDTSGINLNGYTLYVNGVAWNQ